MTTFDVRARRGPQLPQKIPWMTKQTGGRFFLALRCAAPRYRNSAAGVVAACTYDIGFPANGDGAFDIPFARPFGTGSTAADPYVHPLDSV